MASWLKALGKTRNIFSGSLQKVVNAEKEVDEDTLEDLEAALMEADVAPRLVMEIIKKLEKNARKASAVKRKVLHDTLLERLDPGEPFSWNNLIDNACILMVGVNGAGKTTTTAKLAQMCNNAGRKPILGAGDTFRAAGTEQVRIWADRLDVPVVSGQLGSDASSVAFDAMTALKAREQDVLILDTAGRMHTKKPLMDELQKMVRAIAKSDDAAPHEVWIVLDASTGQNALSQAKFFNEVVPLTGIVITKLDGSSKAGFIFDVRKELDVPIVFTGIGEGADDLVPFDAEDFVNSLLGLEQEVLEDA